MKLTRFLAKIGIGNPLNQLFYTHKEIEGMKKRDEISDLSNLKNTSSYKKGWSAGYSSGIKKADKVLLSRMDVNLRRACELWCEWNRKELDAKEFAFKFGELFKDEILAEWNKKQE